MTIEVQNPPGYDTQAMAEKYIRAMYNETPEEFIARLIRERKKEMELERKREGEQCA
jgi:hypothetical protein